MQIEGMKACPCGRQEFLHVLHVTGGRCWECFRTGTISKLKRVTVADGNALYTIELKPRKRKARKRGSADTARLARAARQAAHKRLAQLDHDLYDVLYADERDKRGLPPIPLRVAEGSFAATVAAKLGARVYSAGELGAVDADTHHQTT